MNVNLCCFIVPTCKMYENIVQRIEYLTKLLIHAVSLSAHFLIKLNIFIKSFEQILHFHFFLIGLESLSRTFQSCFSFYFGMMMAITREKNRLKNAKSTYSEYYDRFIFNFLCISCFFIMSNKNVISTALIFVSNNAMELPRS